MNQQWIYFFGVLGEWQKSVSDSASFTYIVSLIIIQ